ncbi:MAG: hypothetical protein COU47_00635 [Candidatus Niyogibacteria bacterium CG10_big_fil_rev_8_21_14_0_10_46_36]|uniref:O-antigen ligase-related domain-containing protein n=1 Tax=Candidatus Niyogibacteria bacterium CG10_big_fil_rev_8_21_14_0_10_46_36 TaxID=1974726 RepID=A0A2H0TG46_9BACT|nr:MAG: hypothetical protein COU47_00635 [Candidatus Niyogibacteria bacterium CG10_big_fil_rev_8_21_14_0_10_46_36]
MQSRELEKILLWVVRIGIYALPFTLLIVSKSAFFPYITTKNFLFRGIVDVVAAGWIGLLILNFKHYWPKKSFIIIAFSLLIGVAFLASVFSTDPSYSFWSNFERMEGFIAYFHLLLLLLVLVGVFQKRRDWFVLFGMSIAASVLLSFYGLLEYAGAVTTFADSDRVISTLGNPLYVAAYLTFHIFLLGYFFFYVRNTYLRVLFAALAFFELVIFFLTGSRGALVGIVAGLGAMVFVSMFMVKEKKKKLIIGLILITLALAPLGLGMLEDVSFVKNNSVLARFSRISITDTTVSSRFIIWGMAVDAFLDRPVLGWGLNNFIIPFGEHYNPALFGNEPWFDRTHNVPLEWLVSTGIIGFFAYLLLIAAILFSLRKAAKRGILKPRDALILFGMVITYLFQTLFVFDVLATHMMLTIVVAFLAVLMTVSKETWEQKYQSMSSRAISGIHIFGVIAVFFASFAFMYIATIKPHRASTALIDAFRAVGEGKNDAVLSYFNEALASSHGTIGEPEVREQLARLVSDGLSGSPGLLQNAQIQAIATRAQDELEKEVASYGTTHPNIRFSIMLGRLYGVLGIVKDDEDLLRRSIQIHEDAIAFAPNYIPLYPFVANFYTKLRQYDIALDLIREAEKKLALHNKFSYEVSYNLPFINVIAERYDTALVETQRLKIWLGGNLNDIDTTKMNVILDVAQGNNSPGGRKFIEDVYNLDPRVTRAGLLLAEIYADEGRYADARRVVGEVLEKDPSLAEEINNFLASLDALE